MVELRGIAARLPAAEDFHVVEVTERAAVVAGLDEQPRYYLQQNRIIGWFQGQIEFGPRALGARSILAPATDAATVHRINALIKRRELFRPLAPAVLDEAANEYFDLHPAGE